MRGKMQANYKKQKTLVMVVGLPGNMARNVAEHILRANKVKYPFELYCHSLTGPYVYQKTFQIGKKRIHLHLPNEAEDQLKNFVKVGQQYKKFIAVDFSLASALISNISDYCMLKIPFVLGATGGDTELIKKLVEKSENCAVVAPNMARPIVALQAMIEFGAQNFPDAFQNFSLAVVESHQNGKGDTSGTAKAVVKSLNGMGIIPFSEEAIKKIREPAEQIVIGVPENHLKGHGWHNYVLESPQKDVRIKISHIVNGRDVYARGTLEAIKFLTKNIQPGKIWTMMDV